MTVNAPIETPVKVVDVFAISTAPVNNEFVAFCHFVTVPIFPDNVKSAGVLPEQIVWLAVTVPPTEVGSTVIVT